MSVSVFPVPLSGIQETLVNAKGDIIAATAADTLDRLAVGTNGQVLTANSATATGLEFATPASGGGMTLLSTTNLSGIATTISSIDQTYINLVVVVRGATFSGSTRLAVVANLNHFDCTRIFDTTLSTGVLQSDSANSSGSATGIFVIVIDNYATTSFRKAVRAYGKLSVKANLFGAMQDTTDALNELQFQTNDGVSTFTAGSVQIFGVK